MAKNDRISVKKVEKKGESSKMRSFRLRNEAIQALHELTEAANEHSNIKLSATNILELLILDAAKGDKKRVLSLIKTPKNK